MTSVSEQAVRCHSDGARKSCDSHGPPMPSTPYPPPRAALYASYRRRIAGAAKGGEDRLTAAIHIYDPAFCCREMGIRADFVRYLNAES